MNQPVAHNLRSNKHSGFSTAFPIYQFTQENEEVPIEEEETREDRKEDEEGGKVYEESEEDEEAAVIEDAEEKEEAKPKTKTVVVDKWAHLNPAPPIWQRYGGFMQC